MSLALLNTKAHCAAAPNSTVRPSVYLVVRAVSNDLYSLVQQQFRLFWQSSTAVYYRLSGDSPSFLVWRCMELLSPSLTSIVLNVLFLFLPIGILKAPELKTTSYYYYSLTRKKKSILLLWISSSTRRLLTTTSNSKIDAYLLRSLVNLYQKM